MKLYEIDNAILNCIDTETGEVIDIDKLMSYSLSETQRLRMLLAGLRT